MNVNSKGLKEGRCEEDGIYLWVGEISLGPDNHSLVIRSLKSMLLKMFGPMVHFASS